MKPPFVKTFISLFVSVIFAGCYTILKHPDTISGNLEKTPVNEYYSMVTYKDDCASCHTHEMVTSPFYDAYYESAPREDWRLYYSYPWWYNDYYYQINEDAANDSDNGESQKRGFVRSYPSTSLTPSSPSVMRANPSSNAKTESQNESSSNNNTLSPPKKSYLDNGVRSAKNQKEIKVSEEPKSKKEKKKQEEKPDKKRRVRKKKQ